MHAQPKDGIFLKAKYCRIVSKGMTFRNCYSHAIRTNIKTGRFF